MAFEITVGPPQLSICDGWSVLTCNTDASFSSGIDHDGDGRLARQFGLYWRDTRLLSGWRADANGIGWTLLNSAVTSHFACQVFLTNQAFPSADGTVPAASVGFVVGRVIGAGGMHEDLDIANYSERPVRFKLGIRLDSDFADIFDVKKGAPIQRGTAKTVWQDDPPRIETRYENGTFRRGLLVTPKFSDSPPSFANGWLLFDVAVEPAGRWHTCIVYAWGENGETMEPPDTCFADADRSKQAKSLEHWTSQAAQLEASHDDFCRLYRQSLEDLAALRLPLEGTDANCFIPAAGIPWFAALFGRDSLIAALQTVVVYPDFARGALEILGKWQATEHDDTRDMQPGKILHELRQGELAHLHLNAFHPYYGTADASLLYPALLHLAWHFTGDRGLLERHVDTARRCLQWAERYGDRDGDGFQEYHRLASEGPENQGWKDAGNSIVTEEGHLVQGPIALCELQGYHYTALLRLAELEEVLGQAAAANTHRAHAARLYEAFNDTFWDEASGAYALCLDGNNRRVMTAASNQGHLLWSGIVPEGRAERVVRRLLEPDLWSGWGIRTLSADNPAYNPHDYQTGAIWPHDNGMIAVGMKSYGFASEAAQVAEGIIAAGSRFMLHRLPEVFAGVGRDTSRFPVQYLGANVPQAWAAGSVFFLLQSFLGVWIDAAAGTISADPVLPEWLPDLTLRGVRVGDHVLDLVVRDRGSSVEIEGDSPIRLLRQPFRGVRPT